MLPKRKWSDRRRETPAGTTFLRCLRCPPLSGVWRGLAGVSALSVLLVAPVRAQSADVSPPSITAFALDTSSVTPTAARMLVTFNEAVTGVDAADFAINGTPNASATITGIVPGPTAASYYVQFSYTGTSGSLQMAIKTTGTGIADLAGNAFAGRGIAATPPYPVNNAPPADMTLPTASFTLPSGSISSPANLSLVFSEPVTGVSADDFLVSPGASVGTVTGTGTTWAVPVSFSGSSPVTITVLGGASAGIRDGATHWFAGGAAAATATLTPGTGGSPSLPAISSPLTASVMAGAPFSYTITATNAPTSYTASNLPAGLNFAAPTLSGSIATPGTYPITITATNASGTDTETLVLTVTPVAPVNVEVISLTPPASGAYVPGQTITLQVTFSSPVTVVPTTGAVDQLPYVMWTARPSAGAPMPNAYGVPAAFPAGHFPPPGSSRIWNPSRPNGQQSAPFRTEELGTVPPGSWLISRGVDPNQIRLAVYDPVQTGVVLADFWYSPAGTLLRQEAGATPGNPAADSGRLVYASGSGSNLLTFRYTVQSGDVAPNGIVLGEQIQRPAGAAIRDMQGNALPLSALELPDASRELPGVVLAGSGGGGGNGGSGGQGPGGGGSGGNGGGVITLKRGDGLVAGEPFTLPATNAAGQAIRWVLVSGNATLNGYVLTPKNRGTVVVRAVADAGTPAAAVPSGQYAFEAQPEGGKPPRGPHRDRLGNVSSRLRVFRDDPNRAAIAGFVVTGSAPKQVLVRAVGPGLAEFGVSNPVSGAQVQLFNQSGQIVAQNGGWTGDASVATVAERVGAFPLRAGNGDAAVLAMLPPGAYTAKVNGAADGVALLEVYDASGTALSTEQLINISTRGFVGTGEGKLIAGFVVTGDSPKRVLIRGVGPALSAFGVAGAVADPELEVVSPAGVVIARNSDWEAATPSGLVPAANAAEIRAAAQAAGAFPLPAGSRDAAVIVSLMPGSYSVVVSDANNATGSGLVEVYELPTH